MKFHYNNEVIHIVGLSIQLLLQKFKGGNYDE